MVGGGGDTLIMSYIGLRRLGSFFWVKILNFDIWGGGGGSDRMNIFWGMKILFISFWGHHKIGLCVGVIAMHFRVFS